MTKTAYTDEQRTNALRIYATEGLGAAVRATNIPKGTIASWVTRTGTQTVAPREQTAAATATVIAQRALVREELRTRLLEKALDMLERMDDPHVDFRGNSAERVELDRPSARDCQSYATAGAILLDKFRLEMGEATGLTEQRLTGGRDRALAVADELRAKRDAKAAAS